MIVCDFCGRPNNSETKHYVNDVIANISQVAGHWNPAKSEKTASDTIHIFKGQACKNCFEELAKILTNTAKAFAKEGSKVEGT